VNRLPENLSQNLPRNFSGNLLAVETSSEACSLALLWKGEVYSRHEAAPMHHAERLLPWTRELLEEAGASLKGLDAIAFGRGPGSFTSLRIGIGAVQGLAWGTELPVIPLSSLAAVAEQVEARPGQTILVAMDARMGEVFHGRFQRDEQGVLRAVSREAVSPPEQVEVADAENTVLAGTAFGRFELLDSLAAKAAAVHAGLLPSATALLSLAQQWLQHNPPLPAAMAQAVYLRDNVAEKPASNP
jgi:tRNA threonylcarbamoyladenosine biosynthesis protein TsaB